MIRSIQWFCWAYVSLVTAGVVWAENWPGWRGPHGDGSTAEHGVVREWDAQNGTNIVWRSELKANGHASPIIWQDKVFLAGCELESTARTLACYDRETGTVVWRRKVFEATLESKHALNSYASGTPATDGELVFAAFLRPDGRIIPAPNVGSPRDITSGTMVVVCFDLEGREQWRASPGQFVSAHGFSSSPVVFEDLVIVNGDHDGDSYVVAFDKRTGTERWRVKRRHKIRSYATPLIRRIGGRDQMLLSGSMCIVSLDPRSGERIWNIEGPTEQFVASMVYDGNLAFMVCGYPDHYVFGIRPDGQGDVTETHVAWESTSARSYVPSPVVVGDYLIVADDRGTANCFGTADGEHLWKARIGSGFNASLVTAEGLVYLTDNDGKTTVIRPGPVLQVVAKNDLGEFVSASPAISGGDLYMRTHEALYRIGKR